MVIGRKSYLVDRVNPLRTEAQISLNPLAKSSQSSMICLFAAISSTTARKKTESGGQNPDSMSQGSNMSCPFL
jgi:hypothetical protein